jgi:hypothetical protein
MTNKKMKNNDAVSEAIQLDATDSERAWFVD